jgi:hypothetical protein
MLEGTLGEIHRMQATPATKVQNEDYRNALDGKVLHKIRDSGIRVLAVAPAQTATWSAVAPKLRQNLVYCI